MLFGETALRLLTYGIIITQESLLSQQIYFLSEPQTNSPLWLLQFERKVYYSLKREFLLLVSFSFVTDLPA